MPAKIDWVGLGSQGTLSAFHQTMRQRFDTRPPGDYHKSMILHWCGKRTGGFLTTLQWERGEALLFLGTAVGFEVSLDQKLVNILEFWIHSFAIPVRGG